MNKIRHPPKTTGRVWPVAVYMGLLAIGIPWYWPHDNYSIVFGMPGWVVVAIVVSFCASLFTAWLLLEPWPGEHRDSSQDPEPVSGDTE